MSRSNVRVPSLDALRDIVRENQSAQFRFKLPSGETKLVLIDLFTASAMVRVHGYASDGVKPIMADKIASGDFDQFMKIANLALRV